MCDKIQGYNATYIFCASRQQFSGNTAKGICAGDSGGPIVDLQPGICILQKIRNFAKTKIQNGETLPWHLF